MARHNREGTGVDQLGHRYRISYQPDWLREVRVSRRLPSGRQSTKVLFRNPDPRPLDSHRELVRTRIESPSQGLVVEVAVRTESAPVEEVELLWRRRSGLPLGGDAVRFRITAFR